MKSAPKKTHFHDEISRRRRLPILLCVDRGRARLQNTSHAVMAQRIEPKDSPDDFPTPPWATRALVERVLCKASDLAAMTCLEPACGAGHMAKALKEYFGAVHCADAYPYGYGDVRDFLTYPYDDRSFDWMNYKSAVSSGDAIHIAGTTYCPPWSCRLGPDSLLGKRRPLYGNFSAAASLKICAIHRTCTNVAGTFGSRCNHSDRLCVVRVGKERGWSAMPHVGAAMSQRA